MCSESGLVCRIAMVMALFVLICCVLPVNAEEKTTVKTTAKGNSLLLSNTSSNDSSSVDKNDESKQSVIDPIQQYKENMSEWQSKISTDLLYLIDPNFPGMSNTRQQVKELMHNHGQLLFANESIIQFSLLSTTNHTIGDHIHVTITCDSEESITKLDPYITKISTVDKRTIVAWVDINNIQKVASLKEVREIEFVIPPVKTPQTFDGDLSITAMPTSFQVIPSLITMSPTTIPTNTSHVSSTPSTPVSFMCILTAFFSATMLVLHRRKSTEYKKGKRGYK